MPYLIDGDNLLGSWPGRRRTDRERRALALQIGRLADRDRKRFVTVFDGNAPPGVAFGANVHFSGAGRSADDVMLEILRKQNEPTAWVVITSDRSLGDQCRHLGARIERCDRFRPRLRGRGGSEKPDREPDVDYGLEQFGSDEPPEGG